MQAAQRFSYGDGEESHVFEPGDEVPDEIADDIPERLLLEKLAKGNPERMTKDQLMRLAGVGPYAEDADPEDFDEDYELDEDELREAMDQFSTKRDLVEWFDEIRPGQEVVTRSMNRDKIEDAIVEALTESE